MKRITAFLFSFLLLFFSINPYIVFAQIDGTSSGGESTLPVSIDINFDDLTKFYKAIWGDFTYKDGWDYGWNLGTAPIQWAKEQLSNFMDDSGKIDTSNPDSPVQSDGTYIYINQNFVNGMNQQVQDAVHALEHYYLFSPTGSTPLEWYNKRHNTVNGTEAQYSNGRQVLNSHNWVFSTSSFLYEANSYNEFYINSASNCIPIYFDSSNNSINSCSITFYNLYSNHNEYLRRQSSSTYISFSAFKDMTFYLPVKVFYSLPDAYDYHTQGRQYYAPNINRGGSGLKIPVQAITNNTINNISQNINITYEGKTEAEIQAQIDATINQRLQELLDNMATPTPTPNPDTTDIPIITPTPEGGGNGNTGDSTNPFIEKIYNWLASFGEKHDTFEKKLSTYLEDNNTKLDTIITALDKIGTGQTTGEENGCKYDYTALSEFLTNLWNESDQKFDTMIELLEKNNDYQKEILKSLDEIKALLIADTVLDFFKDRSQETANKAKDKFPTSLPWDVAMVVNTMCAEPVTPVIHCPIKIESLGIEEEIVIDLTGEEWTKLAKTTRSLLSILFILFLIHLSKDMFYKGGDSV